MHPKLLYTLETLQKRIQVVLENGRSNPLQFTNFIEVNGLNELKVFYGELIPYLSEVKTQIPGCSSLCDEYISHLDEITNCMNESPYFVSFFSDDGLDFDHRSIRPLLEKLQAAEGTIGNLIYQIRINQQ